jgi:hypothetical protein
VAPGKTSAADRARFLAIARGSALECGAILDVGVAIGAVDPSSAASAKSLVARVVAMLTKMTRDVAVRVTVGRARFPARAGLGLDQAWSSACPCTSPD